MSLFKESAWTTDGSCLLQAALFEMRTTVFNGAAVGDRPDVADVGVLVSDGHSTINPSLTVPEARDAKEKDGITMLSVIVNADHNRADMDAIASNNATDVFLLTESNSLDTVVAEVLTRLCNGR